MSWLYPLLSRVIGLLVGSLLLVGCQSVMVEEPDQKSAAKPIEVRRETVSETVEAVQSQNASAELQSIDARGFIKSKAIGSAVSTEVVGIYRGGIVPHHDIAFEMIDTFYQTLETESVDGIILIGPDHQGIGGLCSVGTKSFLTHSGIVSIDSVVQQLLLEDSITEATEVLQEEEHSVGLHMNYISHYFPEIPVIPLYVQDRIGMNGAREILEVLQEQLEDRNYLYIGSVDFSHDQTMAVADQNDQRMLVMIEQENYDMIFRLDNGYIDSSAALFMAMEGARLQGYETRTLIEQNNAAKVLNQTHMASTTSYMTIGFK